MLAITQGAQVELVSVESLRLCPLAGVGFFRFGTTTLLSCVNSTVQKPLEALSPTLSLYQMRRRSSRASAGFACACGLCNTGITVMRCVRCEVVLVLWRGRRVPQVLR